MNENPIATDVSVCSILMDNGNVYKLCIDGEISKNIGTPTHIGSKECHALPRTDRMGVRIIHAISVSQLSRLTRR